MKVGCVVVTFNKLNLLKECISAVLRQTRRVDELFLIDNNSSDQTPEYAAQLQKDHPEVHYHRLSRNIGGAGGFNYGLKKAYESQVDYIWMMDNDTIPASDALEKLIEHINDPEIHMGYLCSNVLWTDGKPCIMNIPTVDERWTEFLSRGLVRVKSASFVSLLIPRTILEEVGYPIKEFFIWGDDQEFTSRISKKMSGYLVEESYAIHKMGQNVATNIVSDDPSRISRYYFDYRNRTYAAKNDGIKELIRIFLRTGATICRVILKKNSNKPKKLWIIIKGSIAGLLFHPNIEKP